MINKLELDHLNQKIKIISLGTKSTKNKRKKMIKKTIFLMNKL